MRDNYTIAIMKTGDWSYLVTKCLTVHETNINDNSKNTQMIIIQSNFLLILNSISNELCVF